MIEEHNFKASYEFFCPLGNKVLADTSGNRTRAYRGRLVKWGMRKYNCRRRSDCSSILSAGSQDGSMSGLDAASPILSQPSARSNHDLSRYSDGGHVRDHNEPTMSNLLERPHNTLEMDTSRSYTEKYVMGLIVLPKEQGLNLLATTEIGPLRHLPEKCTTDGTYRRASQHRRRLSAMPTWWAPRGSSTDMCRCRRLRAHIKQRYTSLETPTAIDDRSSHCCRDDNTVLSTTSRTTLPCEDMDMGILPQI